MAKRRAIATEPRVLRLREVRVYWEDWQTKMTISRPVKKASSKTLKSLKAKVLLMDVKRISTK